jgi:hypothetical protein
MESNVRKGMLIAFAALAVLLIPWFLFGVAPIWNAVAANLDKFKKEDTIFKGLQVKKEAYLGKPDQPQSPVDLAVTKKQEALDFVKAVQDKIIAWDNEFEMPFYTSDNKPAEKDGTFAEVYEPTVRTAISELLIKQGLYDPGATPGVPMTSLVSKKEAWSDNRRKAVQKQVWIYQRLMYSLMKNRADGKGRMIVKVALPGAAAKEKIAIAIENCDEANERDKAENGAKQGIFYDDKNQIRVRLTVIMDERYVPELLEELQVYKGDPMVENKPTKNPLEPIVGNVKPITFIVERKIERRMMPPENLLAPKPGETLDAPSWDDALALIDKTVHPWVRVELTLKVLDYNPASDQLKAQPVK